MAILVHVAFGASSRSPTKDAARGGQVAAPWKCDGLSGPQPVL